MAGMETNDESDKMLQVLDWSYEMALNGLPSIGSAIDLAREYEKEEGTLEDKVNSLIRWQVAKMATSGFMIGSDRLINLPLTIPDEIFSTVYVQIRMIVAIAHMGGYNIKDDKVKTLVYVCLVADSAKNILIDIGIQIGHKFGHHFLEDLSGKILDKINKKIGYQLDIKFGTKTPTLLMKAVSVFSGIVGGSINAIMTNSIGNIARQTFIKTNSCHAIADQIINLKQKLELFKLYTYLNMIKVDGIIKDEEYELIDNLINNSLLDDGIKMELIQKLNSKEMEKIDYSTFKNNSKETLSLLKNLILIANCDNELHNTEKMFIKNIARQLDYSENELENLITETLSIKVNQ